MMPIAVAGGFMLLAARYLGLKLDTPDTPGPECL